MTTFEVMYIGNDGISRETFIEVNSVEEAIKHAIFLEEHGCSSVVIADDDGEVVYPS